jgi:DNA-binding response OmpR family regulator
MEPPPIVYIGRANARESRPLVEAIGKKWPMHTAASGKAGAALAGRVLPRLVIVDAASLRTNGERVCKALRAAAPSAIIVRVMPAEDSAKPSACADHTLSHPLTPRRLVAQVQKHLGQPRERVLRAGPLSLNIDRRVLTAWGQETPLNPKLAELFAVFLKSPNATIERAALMRAVWDTDYTEDTRTLNVHISYARQILEANGHPRILNTVRGIGYRLDLPA